MDPKRTRHTNYVQHTPVAALARKYHHPAYVAVVQKERERQGNQSSRPPAYPLLTDRSRCDIEDESAEARRLENREYADAIARREAEERAAARRRKARALRGEPESSTDEEVESKRTRKKNKLRSQPRGGFSQPRGGTVEQPGTIPLSGRNVCPQCRRELSLPLADGRTRCCGIALGQWCPGSGGRTGALPSSPIRSTMSPLMLEAREGETTVTAESEQPPETEDDGDVDFDPYNVMFRDAARAESIIRRKPNFMPEEVDEREKNFAYNLRKYFVDVRKMKVPPKGSEMKMLPQYSVSYANYPNITFDVVVPNKNKQFFRKRNPPSFFMP